MPIPATKNKKKRMKKMIEINRAEKDIISEKYPNVHIVRTMKQHSDRGHYFCEENKKVMKLLQELRKGV